MTVQLCIVSGFQLWNLMTLTADNIVSRHAHAHKRNNYGWPARSRLAGLRVEKHNHDNLS